MAANTAEIACCETICCCTLAPAVPSKYNNQQPYLATGSLQTGGLLPLATHVSFGVFTCLRGCALMARRQIRRPSCAATSARRSAFSEATTTKPSSPRAWKEEEAGGGGERGGGEGGGEEEEQEQRTRSRRRVRINSDICCRTVHLHAQRSRMGEHAVQNGPRSAARDSRLGSLKK